MVRTATHLILDFNRSVAVKTHSEVASGIPAAAAQRAEQGRHFFCDGNTGVICLANRQHFFQSGERIVLMSSKFENHRLLPNHGLFLKETNLAWRNYGRPDLAIEYQLPSIVIATKTLKLKSECRSGSICRFCSTSEYPNRSGTSL